MLSVSQPIGDQHTRIMLRQIIGVLDEHTSRKSGENVRPAMRENAEQGFWNGKPTPWGLNPIRLSRARAGAGSVAVRGGADG